MIWLGKGIAGDDTHGHVDDLPASSARARWCCAEETNRRDANYAALQENRERLARHAARGRVGSSRSSTLPMPAPLVLRGQRLPASYANFYVANGAVLVPTFNDPNDRVALGMLARAVPRPRR